jgi:hypothetical protein
MDYFGFQNIGKRTTLQKDSNSIIVQVAPQHNRTRSRAEKMKGCGVVIVQITALYG